jgi:hypothetical protein
VVFLLPAEFGLFPCDFHRLLLSGSRLEGELTLGGFEFDSTLQAGRDWKVRLARLDSGGHVHSSTDALAPGQRVCACHGWVTAQRTEYVVSWRRLEDSETAAST